MTDPLDIYDYPIKQFLEEYIRQSGHSSSALEPVIDVAIEHAKQSLPDSMRTFAPRILRERITDAAKDYINAVLSQNKKWQECRERIKAYSSIFLAGAGLSYGSDMPLSNTLKDILVFCGAVDWAELRSDPIKCLAFKQQFNKVCGSKSPSVSHSLLIRNFPEHIWEIICLNWDDLFEKAARLDGKPINKCYIDQPVPAQRYLWKFHGDVENLGDGNIAGQGGWIFPDEPGYVFDSFRDYIKRTGLQNQLFTFVIVGYSENESIIYDQIVTLLELTPPRPTFRIGLDLRNFQKDRYIVGTAEFTLNKILPVHN
jgi:hypothetical protein